MRSLILAAVACLVLVQPVSAQCAGGSCKAKAAVGKAAKGPLRLAGRIVRR
jgi:hypothetical protein